MSYDLTVFLPEALSESDLHALVLETSGLDVEFAADNAIVVVRGARNRYSFTIDGPEQVDAEHLPAEVARRVLGSQWLYSVMVEGTTESEIPHAVRFAKRLARERGGVVLDSQANQVWSWARSRLVRMPQRESRVNAVDVDWFCLRKDVDEKALRLFLATAEQVLPEALPRRFGEYEPLQSKYADSGLEGFVASWSEASSPVHFSGSGFCVGGSLDGGAKGPTESRFWSISLTLLAEPLHGARWRDALRRVMVTLADGFPAFYASASVTRGHLWSERSLAADIDTEWTISPLRDGVGWMGLPPVPSWWTWLGRPYQDHADSLPHDRTTPTLEGVLFESSTEPATADGLQPLDTWISSKLFATFASNPYGEQPAPLTAAETIPALLAEANKLHGAQ